MRLSPHREISRRFAAELPEARTHLVRVDSEWVDVVQVGSGPSLVIVPGLAGGWRLAAPLARHLAATHEVTLVGLRGDRFPYGRGRVDDIGDFAADVAMVIDHLGLERPSVLGLSFGGAVALELASRRPYGLTSLIVTGVEARFRHSLAASIARRVLERFVIPSDSGFVNQFFNLLHGGIPQPGPLVDFVVERCWDTDQSVLARRLALVESLDLSDRLDDVRTRTLVIAGARDVVVPPARQRELAEALPDGRFVRIEGAGHIGFLSHAAEFARAVERDLARVAHAAV